jgi:flavin-dependent dehydrogenase
MHSTVAKLVGADEYHTRPPLQGTYFGYFADVPVTGIELYVREWRAAYAWPTNDDLTLVGANWTASDYPAVRQDIESNFHRVLGDAAPGLAERVQAGRRESPFIGGSIPSYFRTPYGPGWALVGDAGHLKDPCTAQGITDALTHAQLLVDTLDRALDGKQPIEPALADYERRRNEIALPMHEFTCSLAPFAPPFPEMVTLFGSLADSQERTERFFGILSGATPVGEFFGP